MKIQDIKERSYQGYLWYSDKKTPEKIGGKINLTTATNNPFIIEGMLWCEEEQVSVMIRHAGKHIIQEFDLKKLSDEQMVFEDKAYLAHRLKDVEKLKFKQMWKAEKDPLCEGFETLKQQALIFTGFAH